MNPGRLNRKIVIESITVGADEYGANAAPSWSSVATVWANVDTRNGNESVNADKIQASETAEFTINFRSDVTTKCRITYNSKTYNIESVSEIGYRRYLKLSGRTNG